jgi:hypothetical protein
MNNLKSERLEIRLTKQDKDWVKRQAEKANSKSITDYVMIQLKGKRARTVFDKEVFRDLRGVATNINQIAKICNTNGKLEKEGELNRYLDQLLAMMKESIKSDREL